LIESIRVGKLMKNAPVAAETKLGWTVFGKMPIPHGIQVVQSFGPQNLLCTQVVKPEESLSEKIEKFFSTENFGVKLVARDPRNSMEKRAEELANTTLVKVAGRYEIGLLWKS